MKLLHIAALALITESVTGCSTTGGSISERGVSKTPDFHEILWFASRAKAVYGTASEIKQAFPHTVHVGTLNDIDVQYFIERLPGKNVQVVTVRGTANLKNGLEDAEYWQSKNSKLHIYTHKGFSEDASKVYADMVPYLSKEYPVIVTGHSLGAAIATLMMMYLHEDGFKLAPTYNFGQPKVTNKAGVAAYEFLPVTRVVDDRDVVPLVPPATLIDSVHGVYEHVGDEILLLGGVYYSYLPVHDAERKSVGSFWANLFNESITDHYMDNYIVNISRKQQQATAVAYDKRNEKRGADAQKGADLFPEIAR